MGDIRLDVRSAAQFREELERARVAEAQLGGGRRPKPDAAKALHEALMGAIPGVLRSQVLRYLVSELGFSMATLKRFQVGVIVSEPDPIFGQDECTARLTVPHYRLGMLTDIRHWGYPVDTGGISLGDPGCPHVLFNTDCLEGLRHVPIDQRCVFVCGDEWNAMALLQTGYEFVVGANDRTSDMRDERWPAYWTEPFLDAKTIYLCHDADEAGQESAERAARMLGQHRCIRIVPPVRSWVKTITSGLDVHNVDEAIKAGESMAPREVTRPADYLAALETKLFSPQSRGVGTGLPDLDRVLGGLRPGEITVLTGGSGDGKSTFSTVLSYNLAAQGVPVLSIPLELTPVDILEMLISIQARKSSDHITVPELRFAADQVFSLPVYMLDVRDKRGNRRTSMSADEMIEYVRYAMETHGVRFVVLDHLIRFLGGADTQRQQLAMIRPTMEKFAGFVQDSGAHLLIVWHPKTPPSDRKRHRSEYSMDDLWGGTAGLQEAWNGISINRIGEDEEEKTRVRVEKCRAQSGRRGHVDFRFEPEGLRYISGGEAGADAMDFGRILASVRPPVEEHDDDESKVRPIRYYSDELPDDEWTKFEDTLH